VKNGSASGVVACLAGSEVPDDQVLLGCRRDLPDYMVPSRIFHFERMPLNANGKIDRNKLRELVEEMTGAAR
jgi:acyl-CoA synthetase (AMP-forming)/AMP-acid ligase II